MSRMRLLVVQQWLPSSLELKFQLMNLVAQEHMGFERMLAEGVAVAESMQGRIVDDNGVNLTENAVIAIRQHLDGLYSRLEQSGIAAGSATAARLFN